MQGIEYISKSVRVIYATGSLLSHNFKDAWVIEAAGLEVVDSKCHLEFVSVIEGVIVLCTELTRKL